MWYHCGMHSTIVVQFSDTNILNMQLIQLNGISTNYGLDRRFPGDQSKAYHRNGDPSSDYRGYGDKFHTIQVEINHSWRKSKQNHIVKFLSDIFVNFDKECNE